MAKNKSKKGPQQQGKISPAKFLREKARSLPIGKCYINSNWQEDGMAEVIVCRKRPDGNNALGVYLVDTFCLGVKDTFCRIDLTDSEIDEAVDQIGGEQEMEEISYGEAHNIIYGAISFAEEGGIRPHKDFALTRYMLEEDTEDVPLIEYEYGLNGKHYLVEGPSCSERRYIPTLVKNLGGNFDYTLFAGSIDEEYDDYDDSEEYGEYESEVEQ